MSDQRAQMPEETDASPSALQRRIVQVVSSPVLRGAILVVMLAVAIVVGYRIDGVDGVERLRDTIEALGIFGVFAFIFVYAIAGTIFLPAAPFSVGAGVLFGPIVGTLVAFVGVIAGATGAFMMGRTLGRNLLVHLGGKRFAALDRQLATRGFSSVLFLRLAPMFPYALINVAAGVSGISMSTYLGATAIGVIPGTIAYAMFGGFIDEPTSPEFLVTVAVLVVVLAVAAIVAHRVRRGRLPAMLDELPFDLALPTDGDADTRNETV